jgi:hypothetical protein
MMPSSSATAQVGDSLEFNDLCFGQPRRSARDRRVRRERLGVSQTEVIDALEGEQRRIASTVMKLLTEEHRISSPILLHDRLSKDLGLAGGDLDEFMEDPSPAVEGSCQ